MNAELMFYGMLIGVVLVVILYRIGSYCGNRFYDIMDDHFKKLYQQNNGDKQQRTN